MPNSLVTDYRRRIPNDPRNDDELTVLFGKQNDIDGRYNNFPDFTQDYARLNPSFERPLTLGDEIGRGVSRGATSLKTSGVGALALAAGVVGADTKRDALLKRFVELEQESAEKAPASVPTISDVSNVATAGRYALGKLGELVPQLLEALIFGAAGALAGTTAEPGGGTVAGGGAGLVGGLIARQSAKQLLRSGVEKVVGKEALSAVKAELKDIAERKIVKSLTPATEKLLSAQMRAVAGQSGAAGANLVNFYAQGAGAVYGEAANTEGVDKDDAAKAALLGGVGSAIANAPLPFAVVRKFFPGVSQEVAQGYFTRLAKDAATQIPLGATGEALDELVQIASVKYADPKRRNTPLTDTELTRLLDAAVVGGMAGGILSPVSAIPGGRKAQRFDDVIEKNYVGEEVADARRIALQDLKGRVTMGTPSLADTAMLRTLNQKESDFYNLATATPPEQQDALPDWAREEMERRGLDPARPLNDFDIGNPSVAAAVQSDPTLTEEQKAQVLKTGSFRAAATQRIQPTEDATADVRTRVEAASPSTEMAGKDDLLETVPSPVVATFQTAKGSVYESHSDGSTTRKKAARAEHSGDAGAKERSTKTVYVTSKVQQDVLDHVNVIHDPGEGTVVLATDGTPVFGIYESGPRKGDPVKWLSVKSIPHETAPRVGLHPLEFWSQAGKGMSYHVGNEITQVAGGSPTKKPVSVEHVKDEPLVPGLSYFKLKEDVIAPNGETYPSGRIITSGELERFGYEPKRVAKAVIEAPVVFDSMFGTMPMFSVTEEFSMPGLTGPPQTVGSKVTLAALQKSGLTVPSVELAKAQPTVAFSPDVSPELADKLAATKAATPATKAAASVAEVQLKPDLVAVEERGTFGASARGRKETATVQPAWFVPESQSIFSLDTKLLSDHTPPWSGKAGKGDSPRKSQSMRIASILDKQTGIVHNVTVSQDKGQTRVTKFTDEVGPKRDRAKTLYLGDVLDAQLGNGENRFEVIGSARTKEATEYLHDQYPDRQTFEREFAQPLEARQKEVQASAAAVESKLSEAKPFQAETEQAEDEEESSGSEASVDYQEAPMANAMNLDAGDVRTLVSELPAFDSLDDLADLMADASPELVAVMQKISRQDHAFWGRVMASGLETVLKDYGYKIEGDKVDTGKAGLVEQIPTGPAPASVRPAGQRSESGAGNAAPVVAGVQDISGQTQGAERPSAPGADTGNEVTDQPGGIKYRQPGALSDPDPGSVRRLLDIQAAAQAAGIEYRFLQEEVGRGEFSPGVITHVIGDAIGIEDVRTGLHEVAHEVFSREDPQTQRRLLRGISRLTDEATGLTESPDPRLRDGSLPTAQLAEERLVEATALKLAAEGFDPVKAKGFAQAFVRALKDVYFRVARAIQRGFFGHENPELARSYFENRVRRLLAGDHSSFGYLAFLGAGKLSPSQIAHRLNVGERIDRDGSVSYSHIADTDPSAARFNNHAALKYRTPGSDPTYSRRTEIEKRVAVLNDQSRVVGLAFEAVKNTDAFRRAVADLKIPEVEFFRQLLGLADPAALKDTLKDAREQDGTAVEFNPDKTIDQFNHAANRDAALLQAYRNTTALLERSGRIQSDANELAERLKSKLESAQEDYAAAKGTYTDWQRQTALAVKAMRKEAAWLFRSLSGASKRKGVIEQQLRALNPAAVLKEFAPVFQNLFTGEELKGQKLYSLLEALALDSEIDFSKPINELRDDMLVRHLENNAPFDRLLQNTKESQALFATVVAFAKTHAKIMAEIELRRAEGKQRVAIEQTIDDLQRQKKVFTQDLAELARTAKLEERYRKAHLDALRSLRTVSRRVDQAKLKSEVAESAAKVFAGHQAELGARLDISAEAEWGNDMAYNVPDSPTATNSEVARSIKRIQLDSSGKLSNPVDINKDLQKMADFIHEREVRASEGDQSAKDAVYQGVKRQFELIVERNNFKLNVSPAQRFMHELGLMPVGKAIADAFGTPVARMVDQMVNRFVAHYNEMRPAAESIGRRNDQLEDVCLKLLNRGKGLTRDTFRKNMLNPAKRLMQIQHDIEESLSRAEFKRVLSSRIRRMLLKNDATKVSVAGVIDQLMPDLMSLLEFQHESNQFLLGKVQEAKQVLDPKLKVFDPATGQMVSAVRRHVPQGAFTFSQKLAVDFSLMVNALRNSDWGSFAGIASTIDKVYTEEGPDAARAVVARFFNHAEYGDQVRNNFLRAIAEKDTEALFDAPTQADGITSVPAEPSKVAEAYQSSRGDAVRFAEMMYELHNGSGDKGTYVQSVLARLADIYGEIDSMLKKSEGDPTTGLISVRGMTPSAMIDARSIEHLPGQWFDYHSFDQRDMFKTIEHIASQSAFGRDQAELGNAFDTLGKEVNTATRRIDAATAEIRDSTPDITPRELTAVLREKFNKDEYEKLNALAKRSSLLWTSVKELSEFFRRDNAPDGTLRVMSRAASTLGSLLVNNPASGILQLAALFDMNLKYGASRSVISATIRTVETAGKEIAASLAQAIGLSVMTGSNEHRLYVRLGLKDPAAVRKFSDAFDRLQGEGSATHFFRGVNDVMGFGVNRIGARAEHPIFRPLQPFTTSAMIANKALTEGMWKLAARHSAAGIEFYRTNQEKLSDPNHRISIGDLKLKGAEKDSFERLTTDMERWGVDYDRMVRSAIDRNDGTPYSDVEAARLYSLAMSEVSSEASIATMPLAAYNNSILRFISPLLGWSFRRMQQIGSLRLNTEGQIELAALSRGLAGLAVVSLGGLAISALVDEYYEELLGKRRNLRPVIGAPDTQQLALGVLENLNRVGTFGFFGELANAFVNTGEGGDNRMLSVDQRVVGLSAIQAVRKAASAWLNQGEADYTHVARPLAQAVGGGGMLQYLQIANNMLGLDNPEGRATKRANAQNYLRVVGRQLGLDVRTFSGGYTAPTPLTPYLTRMELAAYAADPITFHEEYVAAVEQAREQGFPDPVDHVKRAFASRNPLRSVFRTSLSRAEYQNILSALPDDGRQDVSEAVRLFNSFASGIGITEFEGKREKPAIRFNPSAFRSVALDRVFAQ